MRKYRMMAARARAKSMLRGKVCDCGTAESQVIYFVSHTRQVTNHRFRHTPNNPYNVTINKYYIAAFNEFRFIVTIS